MISSNSKIIIMDKNKLEEDIEYLLNAEEKIELTLRRLKWQDDLTFNDLRISLELTHAVISYLKALKIRRDDKRDRGIENIKNILNTTDE